MLRFAIRGVFGEIYGVFTIEKQCFSDSTACLIPPSINLSDFQTKSPPKREGREPPRPLFCRWHFTKRADSDIMKASDKPHRENRVRIRKTPPAVQAVFGEWAILERI